eukprot:scaffold683_cov124-Cylindrotheca_fusiformis.AAC.2
MASLGFGLSNVAVKATPLQRKLSYIELTMEDSGHLVDNSKKRELRQKYGYCLECEGLPVKLYEFRKSVLNPFRVKKQPRLATRECSGGVCFVCQPHMDPSLSPQQRRKQLMCKSSSFRR